MVGHETAGVLVDTSAWIEALRTDGDAEVRADVRSVVSQGAALFCDIVLLELWNGADGKAEVRLLADLERDLDCVETTVEVWSTANAMARACREKRDYCSRHRPADCCLRGNPWLVATSP